MISAGFKLTDTNESFTVLLEEGQAVIRPGFPTSADLVVELSSDAWQELLLGLTSALGASARWTAEGGGGGLAM
jgi:putative sterol carrier protein